MSFPTQTILTAGTQLRVGNLLANRINPTYTIKIGATAVAPNDTTAGVLATPIFLQAGTTLEFPGNKKIKLTEDATAGSTTLHIEPYTGTNIASGAETKTLALLQVLGGDSLSFTINDNEVSTRSFENGLYDDARKVMIGATIPWSGHYVSGDPAIEQIIQPAAISDKEIYFEITYPDGLKRSGACYVQGYTEDNALDNIRRVSWTFRVVGAFDFELVPSP